MLKKAVNEAKFTLTIEATGPLLIRSGHATISGPDMTPVRTYRNGHWQVYLPGSSLKGVIRSHLERVCRTLNPSAGVVCNPFLRMEGLEKKAQIENGRLICPDYPEVSCGEKFKVRSKKDRLIKIKGFQPMKQEELSNAQVYADSCPICRLFGSTFYVGRVSIRDAYVTSTEHTELRDGVGIDRLTSGAAQGAKFELEVVSSGTSFETEVYLRNFETWQLGMLMLAVQDLTDGLIRVGSGRSRGLGSVRGEAGEVTITHLGKVENKPSNEIWGLGKFIKGDDWYSRYGTWSDDVLTIDSAPKEERNGIREVSVFCNEALVELQRRAISAFVQRIESWQVPDAMTFEHLDFRKV
jgi:CRISPR-associated RAMP protein (TIGR02581 family)